jgi:hypothetical protein
MVNPRKCRKNLRDDALRLALSNDSPDVLASGGAGRHTMGNSTREGTVVTEVWVNVDLIVVARNLRVRFVGGRCGEGRRNVGAGESVSVAENLGYRSALVADLERARGIENLEAVQEMNELQ